VRHKATLKFWSRFAELSPDIQKLARDSFDLLKQDPHHPSLHLKKVHRFWTVRVSMEYRAVGIEENGSIAWFWIGPHDAYDRLFKRIV
jgi:hypothetical protein